MTFTRIKPYGDDAYTVWISGIYKIVSYRAGEFHAYFIQDFCQNWGDHPEVETDNGKHGKCWSSMSRAKAACERHANGYTPKANTVKRAAEIKASLIAQAAEYAVAA
jgi:hypothetical protein